MEKIKMTCVRSLVSYVMQMIWGEKNKITSVLDHKGSKIKQFQMPEQSYISEALLQVA